MRHRIARIAALGLLLASLAACTPTSPPPQAIPASKPSQTPVPAAVLLAGGLEQRALGDYDAAAASFRSLLTAHPDDINAPAARFYLAESFLLRRRWGSAISALEAASIDQHDPALQARALFLLARAYAENGQHSAAASAYQRYRALRTPLEPYAALRQAAEQQASGDLAAAAAGYEHAATSPIARAERAAAFEQAIAVQRQLKQDQQALALYTQLLALAELPDYRARHLLAGASLAQEVGASAQAQAWLGEIISRRPDSDEAAQALALLQADPASTPAAANAARVLFAHERYAEALPLFDAALAEAGNEDDRLELRRLRALGLRAQNDLETAAAELDAVSAAAPASPVGRQARLDRIQTLGWAGDAAGASAQYQQFAADAPNDDLAAEALRRASELLRRQGDPAQAAEVAMRLGQRYPGSEEAAQALEESAQSLADDQPRARQVWQALGNSASGAASAQGYFWAARLAPPAEAQALLGQAAAAAPDSYYGVRAAELAGQLHGGSQAPGQPSSADEWRAADEWLSSFATQPLSSSAELLADQGLQRALMLRELGLSAEAASEWADARARFADKPVQLYALARQAAQHGDAYNALLAATDLAALGKKAGAAAPPPALLRLIYPTPYSSAVAAQARQQGIDPLLLYALLRQESLFNPDATSWVGARGLAQVMPATGQSIAANLGLGSFDPDDLYQPQLSVRFGAYYLGAQIQAMQGSIQGGLAAYNGGPGNAQRWAGGSHVADPDRFSEQIDYPETKGYVEAVYRFYGIYRRLYHSQ